MALKNTGPQLPIPTGYEGQMSEIARKKRMAELLGARAMGDHAPFRSWTEVLAQLGQAFFARKSEKKAASMEGDLRQQQMSDASQAQQAFGMDLDTGASNEDMVRKYANNPWLGTQMEPLLNAWAEKRKEQDKWMAPEKMRDGNNNVVTTQRNGIGEIRQAPGGFTALPNVQNVNDIGVNMDTLNGGEVLPQKADAVAIHGPDGSIIPNDAAIQGKAAIAAAGKPTTTNMMQMQEAKTFGKVIPEAIITDLTKGRAAAIAAINGLPSLGTAYKAVSSKAGLFNGSFADARLGLTKVADLLGIAGKTEQEKIRNSEVFLQSMGSQMFPILQALRPASDTDLLVAKQMSGGNLNLSSGAIEHAVKAAFEAGNLAVKQHRARVAEVSKRYQDPEIVSGIQSFDIAGDTPGMPQPSSPSTAAPADGSGFRNQVEAEIARRKALRGGR